MSIQLLVTEDGKPFRAVGFGGDLCREGWSYGSGDKLWCAIALNVYVQHCFGAVAMMQGNGMEA